MWFPIDCWRWWWWQFNIVHFFFFSRFCSLPMAKIDWIFHLILIWTFGMPYARPIEVIYFSFLLHKAKRIGNLNLRRAQQLNLNYEWNGEYVSDCESVFPFLLLLLLSNYLNRSFAIMTRCYWIVLDNPLIHAVKFIFFLYFDLIRFPRKWENGNHFHHWNKRTREKKRTIQCMKWPWILLLSNDMYNGVSWIDNISQSHRYCLSNVAGCAKQRVILKILKIIYGFVGLVSMAIARYYRDGNQSLNWE